jgi:exodeoxyribonuclease VII large subunit
MTGRAAEALPNAQEYTVSELSMSLKRTVEDVFGHVRVRGEISGFRGPHSSGHCYFALKDDSAKIEAVIWKGVHGRMRFKPQEGLEVIATGKLTTYPGSSKYQIVIEALEPAGVGALMALMEERKRKLAAEGLFDEARKQLLPWLPEVIGVVTSPTGAVIRDILHRLEDRFPRRVLVWPVRRPDLLIVARGGGSLEDLWSFNEEIVVRAAADSMIPLISAVGHETDVTLIDFAADKRAPTPTAAAEMAVPVRAELFVEVASLARRAMLCWQRAQESRRGELRAAARALPRPDALLDIPRQRLDRAGAQLPRALRANAHVYERQLSAIGGRLTVTTLRLQIERAHEKVTRLATGAERSARLHIQQRDTRLRYVGQLLNALSYKGVLQRGFALVRDDAGQPLHTAAHVGSGQRLSIEFADGRIAATADGEAPPAKPKPASAKPAAKRATDFGVKKTQGDLF